jgi:uncharacterized membrane protein (UPF0127 family)
MRLIRGSDGATVVEALEVADGLWSRVIGLQFRRSLSAGAGLLLVPCHSVHTFFCRFPIDMVLLDRQAKVIGLRLHVRPWQIIWPVKGTHAILELPAGAAFVDEGDVLRLAPLEGSQPRESLSFLVPSAK